MKLFLPGDEIQTLNIYLLLQGEGSSGQLKHSWDGSAAWVWAPTLPQNLVWSPSQSETSFLKYCFSTECYLFDIKLGHFGPAAHHQDRGHLGWAGSGCREARHGEEDRSLQAPSKFASGCRELRSSGEVALPTSCMAETPLSLLRNTPLATLVQLLVGAHQHQDRELSQHKNNILPPKIRSADTRERSVIYSLAQLWVYLIVRNVNAFL